MTYASHNRHKRDATEGALVEYLEKRGALVARLSCKGIPDLLVGFCGRWLLLECKSEAGSQTKAQREFFSETRRRGLPCYEVRTIEEVTEIIDRTSRL